MTLRERDGELRQLTELMTDTRAGHSRVALISAAAGLGKTALLHTFWDTLAKNDAILLSAGCGPSDREVPFGVLSELLQSPGLGEKHAAQAMRLLDDCALLLDDSLRTGPRAAWAERGFARLVSELSERRPVVVCVDDVHHADPESVAQLLRLVRRMHSARALVVLTERPRPAGASSPLHSELVGQPHVRYLRLRPLSQRGVQEMIGAGVGPDGVPLSAADCHAATGGSPLLVQAMLQDLARTGQPATPDAPAAAPVFAHTVLGCLYSNDPVTRSVARAAALLDEASGITLLSRLLDLPPETVTAVVAELGAMGLMHGCRLRDRTAARAILGDIAPDDRLSWHLRAARLLFETHARPSAVARHLLRAGTAKEQWMVKCLIDAADEELDNDTRHAKACLELARQFSAGNDPEQRAEIAAALARAEMRLSPLAALRLFDGLRTAISEGTVSGRLALELPQHLYCFGGAADNERLYRDLERLVGTEEPRNAMELGACRMVLTTVFPQLAERISDALEQVNGVALASAAFTTNSRLRVFGGLSALLREGPSLDTVRYAEQVLTVTRLTDNTAGLLSAAVHILIGAERPEPARRWADRLLREATTRGAAAWQGLMAARRAEVALCQGDLPAVERHALLSLNRLPPPAWGVSIGGLYATMLRAYTEMGRHSEAADLLSRPVPDALFDSVYGLQYLHAKGHHYLATRQYRMALSDFRACGELMARWGLEGCTVVPWRTGAAEALLRLGVPNAARRLAEEQLEYLGPRPSRLRGAALRVLAASRTVRERVPLLNEAVELCRGRDDVELAKALVDLSKAHRRMGDTALALMTARRALHKATECQAVPLVRRVAYAAGGSPDDSAFGAVSRGGTGARAADDIPSAPDRRAAPDGAPHRAPERLPRLSDAERRVCELAGRGLTNREIAARLFITVSTVEQHLTRIYRKLRVKGREQLPASQGTGKPGAVLVAAGSELCPTAD